MNNLKLYHFDCGYQGSIVVIAESKKDAYNKILVQEPYCIDKITSPDMFEEHEIKNGLFISGGGAY